jgi:putative ABC transport system substrate-binding protein
MNSKITKITVGLVGFVCLFIGYYSWEKSKISDVVTESNLTQETSAAHPPKKDQFKIFMVLWSGETSIEKGFQAYFKEHDIKAEYIIRDCQGDNNKCHALVKEIRETKPDLIYTWGTPAALAIAGTTDAKNKDEYVWDTPIVSTIVGNPIFSKIIYDLEKPGRNLTGVNHVPPYDAQLNSMLSYSKFNKVGVMYIPSENPTLVHVDGFEQACKDANIEVVRLPYDHLVNNRVDPQYLNDFFKNIKTQGINIIYFPPSNYLSVDSKIVCDAANANKLLTFIATELMVTNGSPLMGLISSYLNIGRFAAEKAQHILVDGRDPSAIPYERFAKYNFFINREIMKLLNVYPPLDIVDHANFN